MNINNRLYWRFYLFLYYLYCLSIFQRTCRFRFKSGCKGKRFIFNYQTFSEVFFSFSFYPFLRLSMRKGKNKWKEEQAKHLFFANRTAKIRTFLFIFQNFSEVFLFLSQAVLRFVTKSFSSRLSSLGKRVQKYSLSGYKTNIYHSFFWLFFYNLTNLLIDRLVQENRRFYTRSYEGKNTKLYTLLYLNEGGKH